MEITVVEIARLIVIANSTVPIAGQDYVTAA